MPIDQVPYVEPLTNPLVAAWRSYFQSVWTALRGWKRTGFFLVANPMTTTVFANSYRVEVLDAPAGALVDYDSVIHITPKWSSGNETVIFEAQGTSAGQIAYTAHNYGASNIDLGTSGPDSFYLLIFNQK